MISLKDFISSTLVEIAEGVKDAKGKTDISIAPGKMNKIMQSEPQMVKFSLNVEVFESDASSKERSLGLIKVITAGVKNNSENNSTRSSSQSIEFSVPIFLQAKKVIDEGNRITEQEFRELMKG